MIVALWFTGLIFGSEQQATKSGGMAYGSGSVRRHFEDRAIEQFASKVTTIRAKTRKAKDKTEAAGKAVETLVEAKGYQVPQELLARADEAIARLERASEDAAAYRSAMAAMSALVERAKAAAETARKRRIREEELILSLIARIA